MAMKSFKDMDYDIELYVHHESSPAEVMQLFLLCKLSVLTLKEGITYQQNIKKGKVKKPWYLEP